MMQETPDDDDALKARLAKLSSDLQAQRDIGQQQAERKAESDLSGKGLGQAMSLGFRVLSEFVAAIVVGGLLGWRLDLWLGTGPIFLIALLGLGMVVGFLNVYRLAMAPPTRDLDNRGGDGKGTLAPDNRPKDDGPKD